MTDHKFTDEENILLLLKWSDDLYANTKLSPEEAKILLDLINRQKAEITRLITSNSQLEARVCEDRAEIERLNAVHADMTESLRLAAEANKDMQAEIERLKKIGDDKTSEILRHAMAIGELHKQLETARSEAIKEFAERLVAIYENDKTYDRPNAHTLVVTVFRNIDTLVKEMTEGKNA